MAKWKKFVIALIGLLLITVLADSLIRYQSVGQFQFHLLAPKDYPIVGGILPIYFFWMAAIFMILILIGIIVVALIPKTTTTIPLKQDKGTLTLSKSAVDGLVKASANETEWLKNPRVKTKMKKKKVRVEVTGTVRPTVDTYEKVQRFNKKTEDEIHRFLGVEAPVEIHVTFKDLQKDTPKRSSQARVQ